MVVKVAISCDDLNPSPGFGLFLNNDSIKYVKKLNDEFGCKTTMFTVPIWEENQNYDIRQNKAWLDKVKAMKFIEIAQHGCTHKPTNPAWGGQEFLGRDNQEIYKRIVLGKQMFRECGIEVKGFKSPGWAQPKEIYQMLNEAGFSYIGDHFIGGKPIQHDEKLKRIPYTWTIDKLDTEYAKVYKDDYLVLHSHINSFNGHTKNAWDEVNYNKVREFLLELQKHTEIEYVFFSEMI